MKKSFDNIMNEERFNAVIQLNSLLIRVTVTLLSVVFLGITAIIILSYANFKKDNKYFATTVDGKLYALQPLTEPVLSPLAVSTWGSRIIQQTFSFNYLNVEEVLSSVKPSYTHGAFLSLMANLKENGGLISDVIEHKYLVNATLLSAPRMVEQGTNTATGKYQWNVVYPMLVTFKNEGTTLSARFNIETIITRADQRNNPFGIVIDKVIATEGRINE